MDAAIEWYFHKWSYNTILARTYYIHVKNDTFESVESKLKTLLLENVCQFLINHLHPIWCYEQFFPWKVVATAHMVNTLFDNYWQTIYVLELSDQLSLAWIRWKKAMTNLPRIDTYIELFRRH